jgi:chaperone modulatory protein CbpM
MNPITVTSQISVQLLDENAVLTLDEFCRACATPTEFILELMDEGIVHPQGSAPESWRFSGIHLERARIALRLQRDLGVNLAGAALALQLLEEVAALRARLLER